MNYRVIPRNEKGLISLSAQSVAAAFALGATLDLKQNNATALATDHFDLVGASSPGELTIGKIGAMDEARAAELAAEEVRRNAIAAGRAFNGRGLDHLKGILGRRSNPHWLAAGFTSGSLALPVDPVPLLLQFRTYFQAHPTHEFAVNAVTAAEADALVTAIVQAVTAEATAKTIRAAAVKARDEALVKVRARLVGLRAELRQLLGSDDVRWRTFGFARPSDRRKPAPVPSVAVRETSEPGEVIVEWEPATGADSYRVLRQVEGVDSDPVEVGIFADGIAIISGLPPGRPAIISVTARNAAGESRKTDHLLTISG